MELYGSLRKDVLEKLYAYCAYQERCRHDVKKKLNKLEIPTKYQKEYLEHLEIERFLDESRFVNQFVKGKLRGNKWGKRKIKFALYQKSIPESIIDTALANIVAEDYTATALALGQKKWRQIKDDDIWKKKQKLYAYLAQKGFEKEVIQIVIEKIISERSH